ncbi:hypothetical protein J437_LFUL012301 [Ladona fulva]|uniref:Spaetzle domain-containing protein n=1 Tax=Ladona fulva TaxID=123851 RepID=A0A8K0KD10_LADFU|nr:hypothetical protein J437_LFUL012301 [Ladona fulva]
MADESRTEYKTPRPPPAYHPYHYTPGYTKVPLYYPPPPSQHVLPQTNSSMPFAGYPDRRYKLDPQFVGPLVYTAVLPPQSYMPSEDWWSRFSRSVDAETKEGPKEKSREKRQSNQGNTIKLCPTNFQYIMPKAALNNRGNWMYVVNLNEVNDRYTQLVRSETCAREGKIGSTSCNGLCSLPNGYTSACQQQYVQKRLVALESSGDRLYTDVFWFPHCCICQITQNNNG